MTDMAGGFTGKKRLIAEKRVAHFDSISDNKFERAKGS